MDSVTHLFLGGAIAAAVAPARFRGRALLAGALLNSLPDIDVLPLLLVDDPVSVMVWHRSATHSLLVLPFLGALLWWLLKARVTWFAEAPMRSFLLIQACLLAHPLVDAFTIYGTQLWWPLPLAPTMWSSLFIIDPLFTLPLVVGCVAGWLGRGSDIGRRALLAGLILAALYLGWSQFAKWRVEQVADASLRDTPLEYAPRFSVPMPFTTLLWRVVVMTPDGFLEARHSLVADTAPLRFTAHHSDTDAIAETSGFQAVQRLLWFTHGFVKAEHRDGTLVLSDLRMGAEPDYSFRFAVARQDGGAWQPMDPRQLKWPWSASRRLPEVWRRIWNSASEEAP